MLLYSSILSNVLLRTAFPFSWERCKRCSPGPNSTNFCWFWFHSRFTHCVQHWCRTSAINRLVLDKGSYSSISVHFRGSIAMWQGELGTTCWPKGGEPHCIELSYCEDMFLAEFCWMKQGSAARPTFHLLIDPLCGFAAAPGMVELLSAAHGRVFWRSYRSCSRSLPAQRNWSPSNRMWTALPGSQLPWATFFGAMGQQGVCNFSKAIGPYQHQLIPSFVFDFLRKALVAQIFQGLCHFWRWQRCAKRGPLVEASRLERGSSRP